MTNSRAYDLLVAYSHIKNFPIKGLPFSVQRLAERNYNMLICIEEERQAIFNAEDRAYEEKKSAWLEYLSLPFDGKVEILDESKIEDIANQELKNGVMSNTLFSIIMTAQG